MTRNLYIQNLIDNLGIGEYDAWNLIDQVSEEELTLVRLNLEELEAKFTTDEQLLACKCFIVSYKLELSLSSDTKRKQEQWMLVQPQMIINANPRQFAIWLDSLIKFDPPADREFQWMGEPFGLQYLGVPLWAPRKTSPDQILLVFPRIVGLELIPADHSDRLSVKTIPPIKPEDVPLALPPQQLLRRALSKHDLMPLTPEQLELINMPDFTLSFHKEPGIEFRLTPTGEPLQIRVTGKCYHVALLDYFEELLKAITQEWPEAAEQLGLEPPKEKPVPTKDTAPSDRPWWFPKTPKTVTKWKRCYADICDMRDEYRNMYDEGDTTNPNPTIDDIRDRLAQPRLWGGKPSLKTVSRITTAGDQDWLD